MKLLHYSIEPFKIDDFKNEKQYQGIKPKGLWLSDDECKYNWKWWCQETDFHIERLRYIHEIILNDNAKILLLKTRSDILNFSKEHFNKCNVHNIHIEWQNLEINYDGIIITPYQWSLRHHINTLWYYWWDCASGCIWNKNAIKEIKLLENE